MDNLGDWLYIVLLVIAGISGLLGAGKKKKRPEEVDGRPEYDSEPEVEYEDYWEETPFPPREYVPEKPKETPKQSAYVPLFVEGERIMTDAAVSSFAEDVEEEYAEYLPRIAEGAFRDADELKKAVIYAEILNRKY
jgi:hypothetical protein